MLNRRGRFDTSASAPPSFTPTPRSSRSLPLVVPPPLAPSQKPRWRAMKRRRRRRQELRRPRRAASRSRTRTGSSRWICSTRCRRCRGATHRRAVVSRPSAPTSREKHNLANAFRHFERAREVVPDDPDVLFGEACLQETLGSPRHAEFFASRRCPTVCYIRALSRRTRITGAPKGC